MDLLRSWMFVPGHRQRMIDKALGLNADAIMLDIEDGVAPNEKDTRAEKHRRIPWPQKNARLAGSLCAHQRHRPPAHGRRSGCRRPARIEGLVLPKVDTVSEVRKVDAILTDRESKRRMPSGGIKLLIAIESPKGLLNAPAIAASSPRVSGLMFGAEDFGREIGLPDGTRRRSPRSDLRALSNGHRRGVSSCSGRRRRLGRFKRQRRTSRLCQAIAPARLLRHVVYSSVANRCHQYDLQPDGGGNRLLPKSSASLRRSQCPGRRLDRLRRPADRPADRRARAPHHRHGQVPRTFKISFPRQYYQETTDENRITANTRADLVL